jgi:DNA-binding beta-propeller fold protein YncE
LWPRVTCCNNRIQKFDGNGTFLSKWGSSGSGDGQFDGPQGVSASATGNVYVADRGNDRVQLYGDASFTLAADRDILDVLDNLSLRTFAGEPAAPYGLCLLAISGTPLIRLIEIAALDGNGQRVFDRSVNVPFLSGQVLTFGSFTLGAFGWVIGSNKELVTFR